MIGMAAVRPQSESTTRRKPPAVFSSKPASFPAPSAESFVPERLRSAIVLWPLCSIASHNCPTITGERPLPAKLSFSTFPEGMAGNSCCQLSMLIGAPFLVMALKKPVASRAVLMA